jgi:hypothetical protein
MIAILASFVSVVPLNDIPSLPILLMSFLPPRLSRSQEFIAFVLIFFA